MRALLIGTLAAIATAVAMAGGAAATRSAPTPAPYDSPTPLPKPVLFAPGIISTGDSETHPLFTADGRTLYFLRNSPDFNHWTIVRSHFAGGAWSTPEVAPFSGRYNDADPALSADGRTMFFVSTRPPDAAGAPKEDTDLWTVQATPGRDGGWGEPRRLAELSSTGNEWFPTLTRDGTIYFGSERPGGHGKDGDGTADLWRSRLVNGRYAPPENLGDVINTPGQEIEPYIAPDESYLIFSAKGRQDSRGSYDLYVSYNCKGTWTPPANLGDAINSSGWEFAAKVSPDGKYLFFATNRSRFDTTPAQPRSFAQLNELLRGPGNGLHDIYQVDIAALRLQSPCGR